MQHACCVGSSPRAPAPNAPNPGTRDRVKTAFHLSHMRTILAHPSFGIGVSVFLLLPLFRLGSGAPDTRSFLQRSPQQSKFNTVVQSAANNSKGDALDKYLASYFLRPSFTATSGGHASDKYLASYFLCPSSLHLIVHCVNMYIPLRCMLHPLCETSPQRLKLSGCNFLTPSLSSIILGKS